jgi:hypothetical protein
MHKRAPDGRDHLPRQDDSSRHGHPGDHIRGRSGHECAAAYERSRHSPGDWHEVGDRRPDREYDRRDHRDFAPRSSPRSPSMSDSQLFRMESALSWAAWDWHGGYRGSVADGVRELIEGDLRALHVSPDTQLSIIDSHFKIMSAYTRFDSYNRLGPNLGGARKYTDWPKLTTLSVDAFVEFYGQLTGESASFDIGLTPFAGIDLRFGQNGLCLPGLGVTIAYEHARALWSLLAKLLPEKAVIQAQIDLTQQEQHGYKLLWQVGLVCLDDFDLVRAVKEPR